MVNLRDMKVSTVRAFSTWRSWLSRSASASATRTDAASICFSICLISIFDSWSWFCHSSRRRRKPAVIPAMEAFAPFAAESRLAAWALSSLIFARLNPSMIFASVTGLPAIPAKPVLNSGIDATMDPMSK